MFFFAGFSYFHIFYDCFNYYFGSDGLCKVCFHVKVFHMAIIDMIVTNFRYLAKRIPPPGFYNPPPMMSRSYHHKSNGAFSQSTLPRSEYSSSVQKSRYLSNAMSQNTIGSQRSVTATSTVL